MKREFSDELISAFLDGELTAEEQAQVEQQLLDSAEHRKMFAELRALRDSLQALPNHQLDGQFHERVMKKAERAMLTDPAPVAADTDTSSKADQPAAPSKKQSPTPPIAPAAGASSAVVWRRAFWCAAAVAASLLLAVIYLPRDRDQQPSNMALHSSDVSSPRASEAERSAVDGGDEVFEQAGAGRLADEGEKRSQVGDSQNGGFRNDKAVRKEIDRDLADAKGDAAAVKQQAVPRATQSRSGFGTGSSGFGGAGASALPGSHPPIEEKSPAPGNFAKAPANAAPNDDRASSSTAGRAMMKATNGVEAELALDRVAALPGPPLVVKVLFSPQAHDGRLLEQVLAKNEILLESASEGDSAANFGRDEGAKRQRRAPREPANRAKLEELAEEELLTGISSDYEVVVVDASAAQINAVLDELHSHRGDAELKNYYAQTEHRADLVIRSIEPARAGGINEDRSTALPNGKADLQGKLLDAVPAGPVAEGQSKAAATSKAGDAGQTSPGQPVADSEPPRLASPPAAAAQTGAGARTQVAPTQVAPAPRPGGAEETAESLRKKQSRAPVSAVEKKNVDGTSLAQQPDGKPTTESQEKPRESADRFSQALDDNEGALFRRGRAVRIPAAQRDAFLPGMGGAFGGGGSARFADQQVEPQAGPPQLDDALKQDSGNNRSTAIDPAAKKLGTNKKGESADKLEAAGDAADDDDALARDKRREAPTDAVQQAGQKSKYAQQNVRVVFVIGLLPDSRAAEANSAKSPTAKPVDAAEAAREPNGK